jgi:hypothetical protein
MKGNDSSDESCLLFANCNLCHRDKIAHEAGTLAWYLPFAAMCIAAPILVLAP